MHESLREPLDSCANRSVRIRTTAVDEIRKAVASCIETGQVLHIAERSEEIARLTGEERERTAKSLLEAGIMARVNIEFGT